MPLIHRRRGEHIEYLTFVRFNRLILLLFSSLFLVLSAFALLMTCRCAHVCVCVRESVCALIRLFNSQHFLLSVLFCIDLHFVFNMFFMRFIFFFFRSLLCIAPYGYMQPFTNTRIHTTRHRTPYVHALIVMKGEFCVACGMHKRLYYTTLLQWIWIHNCFVCVHSALCSLHWDCSRWLSNDCILFIYLIIIYRHWLR